MGLSNYLPTSAIAKPGVIANAAARPASPYDGQVVYQQDTDQAYVWNGSAWVLLSTGTANPPGLEHITTSTFSAASSPVGINGCFTSSYNHYRLMLSIGTSATTDLRFRLRYGTSTQEAGAVYDRYGFYWNHNTPAAVNSTASNQTSGYVSESYLGASDRAVSTIDLFNPNNTVNTNAMVQAWGTNTGYLYFYNTRVETTTQYTGFELSCDSGTLTGNISVYGYRN